MKNKRKIPTEIFEKKRMLTIQLYGEETKNLRSGNCNAENYFPRTTKHCKVRRCAFKLKSLSDNINKY